MSVFGASVGVGSEPTSSGAMGSDKERLEAETAPRLPVYKPPKLGAPSVRVGGATRSIERIYVLAPDHVGLTTSAQPRLYWFVSAFERNPARFVLKNAENSATILEHTLAEQPSEGFGYLDLKDLGVRLTEGINYQWSVELIRRGDDASTISSLGFIQRVAPKPQTGMTAMDEIPFAAAQAGLWYDAITAVSRLIEFEPKNPLPRQERAALLRQIGLGLAADYDLRIADAM
jgi:hypothetical protein